MQLRPPVRFVVHPDGVLEHDVDVPEDFTIHLVATYLVKSRATKADHDTANADVTV